MNQVYTSADHFWTGERVTTLRALFEQGLSNAQIAVEMNIKSRGAIIGKLHRLGLRREAGAAGAPKPVRVSSTRVAARLKEIKRLRPMEAFVRTTRASPSPAFESDGVTDLEIEIGDHRVSLLSAGPDQCRWPAADDGSANMVCGAHTASGPYCARHHFRSVQSRPVASRGEVATG